MLTDLDDTLRHQAPLPFAFVGTSDHRFYDRYWFEAVAPDGSAGVPVNSCPPVGSGRRSSLAEPAVHSSLEPRGIDSKDRGGISPGMHVHRSLRSMRQVFLGCVATGPPQRWPAPPDHTALPNAAPGCRPTNSRRLPAAAHLRGLK